MANRLHWSVTATAGMPASATASISSGTRTTLSISEYSVCSRKCTNFTVIGSPMPSIELDRSGRFAERAAVRQAFQAAHRHRAAEPAAQRIEAAAVNRRGTQARERDQVHSRGVTEVHIQAVARMLHIEPAHERVAIGL